MKKMKKLFAVLTAILLGVVLSGCGASVSEADSKSPDGGRVVVDFPSSLLKRSLIEKGVIGAESNTTVFGYRAYLIEYETKDEKGESVTASGLMVVPSESGLDEAGRKKLEYMKAKGFSTVLDGHGTIFADEEAPTVGASMQNVPEGSPTILSSLYGFVTLQPDYIGFGSSVGHQHPYLLEAPTANSMLDFAKAAKEFAEKKGIPLNGQLYITGYSEGGYAALSSAKAYEEGRDESGFSLQMSAPMAGPYLMYHVARGIVELDSIEHPSFIADVAYSYALAYGKSLSQLVQSPYDSMIERLFDGSYEMEEIEAVLPKLISGEGGLLREDVVDSILADDSDFWFNEALKENSPVYWAPKRAMFMLHCLGDDIVPYAISASSVSIMRDSYGAQSVSLIPVEAAISSNPDTSLRLSHTECALPAYAVAASIFANARKKTIGY
jgi:hypothetical protein